jgi:hypothetical protein
MSGRSRNWKRKQVFAVQRWDNEQWADWKAQRDARDYRRKQGNAETMESLALLKRRKKCWACPAWVEAGSHAILDEDMGAVRHPRCGTDEVASSHVSAG